MKDVYGYVGDLRNTDKMLQEYVDKIVTNLKDEVSENKKEQTEINENVKELTKKLQNKIEHHGVTVD